MDENIKIILNKDIATLSFYHPKANSLPLSLLNDLKSTILDLYNQDVKVLVLKSANEKVFCSGASFDELLALKDIDGAISFFSAFAAHFVAAMTMQSCLHTSDAAVQH